jgi:hypothetical protein
VDNPASPLLLTAMACRAINLVMNKLADAEQAFLASEFLAPVVSGSTVTVRIVGVRCELAIEPADFRGWGVFHPMSAVDALLVRSASRAQRQRYLELFPAVRLVICKRDHDVARAMLANPVDGRFRIDAPVDVQLAHDAELFDTVIARFDGARFWFDSVDPRADPAAAAYLRQQWIANTEADKVDRAGLTAGQLYAYRFVHNERSAVIRVAAERREAARRGAEYQRGELRLANALSHAGAKLHDFIETPDAFRVTYTVDGRRHISVVDKCDLTVHSAGICLAGEDKKFDLDSLVGVLREGTRRRRIH